MVLAPKWSNWMQLVLATPVVLWAGWPFFVRGWQSLVTRNLNMFTLIAMGTGRRLGLQRRRDAGARPFPAGVPRRTDGAVPVYFEAAAVITVLVLLGQVLELRAREQTSRRDPRAARPRAEDRAPRRADGTDEEVPLDAIAVGDRLRVRPGEKVPVDGEVDRRPLVGRRVHGHRRIHAGRPRSPAPRSSAARSTDRQLRHARREGRRATPCWRSIVQMVAEAQRSRAPIQRLADQVAGWFVPAVIAVALARLRRLGDVRPGAALRLRPRRRGRGADHRLPLRARPGDADVDHGRRRTRRPGRRADQERRGAGAHGEGRHAGRRQDRHADRGPARRSSASPAGASTRTSCCGSRPASSAAASIRSPPRSSPPPPSARLALAAVTDFDSPTGKGVVGTVDGRALLLGNARSWPSSASTTAPLAAARPKRCASDGATAIFVAVDGKLAGVLAIADPIKATTPRRMPRCAPRASASSC